jgi:hypothetical protein
MLGYVQNQLFDVNALIGRLFKIALATTPLGSGAFF